MFPTIKDCNDLGEAEAAILAEFDRTLREAMINLHREAAAQGVEIDIIKKARATVLMSVTADAALEAYPANSQPGVEAFLAMGRDAFNWAHQKRRIAFNA